MKLHEVQRHRLEYARYLQPASIDEAVEMLSEHGAKARLIAGGTDLLLELTRGVRSVDILVDISRTPGLDRIDLQRDELLLGAGVTHNEIVTSATVVERALPLAQACWEIASPQLRNRATVVGNLVTASPANDTISALRALGTTVEIASSRGRREIDLADFHHGVRKVDLADDEMVTSLRVRAMMPSERGIFAKLGLRKAQAISVVHLAAVLDFDGDIVTKASIALGSVAPTIIKAEAAEQFLSGRKLDDETIAEASRLVASAATPISDLRATAEYRSTQLEITTIRVLNALCRSEQARYFPQSAVTLGKRQVSQNHSTRVNGRPIFSAPPFETTLLDWLRLLGLTGSKEGCAEGECGACTVFLDGVAVMSCLVPAGRAEGAEITTIEGLASEGALHPLQQAFLDQGAVQCGFCIPGFLMSGAKLLAEKPHPDPGEVRTAFAGNLCRCTGYYKILAAIEQVSGQ